MSFTLIFGLYASFVFIKTESIIAPILLHFHCNIFGFPKINQINKGPDQRCNPFLNRNQTSLPYWYNIISFDIIHYNLINKSRLVTETFYQLLFFL